MWRQLTSINTEWHQTSCLASNVMFGIERHVLNDSFCILFWIQFFWTLGPTREPLHHLSTFINRRTSGSIHLLAAASIISAAINLSRWARCSANTSSGQCRSWMNDCRASSFQSRSSDVAQPLLQIYKYIFTIKEKVSRQDIIIASHSVTDLNIHRHFLILSEFDRSMFESYQSFLKVCVLLAQMNYSSKFHINELELNFGASLHKFGASLHIFEASLHKFGASLHKSGASQHKFGE